MKNHLNCFTKVGCLLVLGILASGCADERAGTGDGVTIKSAALNVLNASLFEGMNPNYQPMAVSDFQFCITQLKVVTGGTAGDAQEAILGHIDLSGSAATTWGSIDLTDGTLVEELHFEIHRDPENCGGFEYSMSYQGQSLTRDLEFKFQFSPALEVASGDSLVLTLDPITTALEAAFDAGDFNNEEISNYLEETTKGSGERE